MDSDSDIEKMEEDDEQIPSNENSQKIQSEYLKEYDKNYFNEEEDDFWEKKIKEMEREGGISKDDYGNEDENSEIQSDNEKKRSENDSETLKPEQNYSIVDLEQQLQSFWTPFFENDEEKSKNTEKSKKTASFFTKDLNQKRKNEEKWISDIVALFSGFETSWCRKESVESSSSTSEDTEFQDFLSKTQQNDKNSTSAPAIPTFDALNDKKTKFSLISRMELETMVSLDENENGISISFPIFHQILQYFVSQVDIVKEIRDFSKEFYLFFFVITFFPQNIDNLNKIASRRL